VLCVQCGKQLAPEALFCSACGAPAPADTSRPATTASPSADNDRTSSSDASAAEEAHGVRGWLAHRKAERERETVEEARFQETLVRLRSGEDSPAVLADLRQFASDPDRAPDAHAALREYSEHLLADDVLTADEESRFGAVTRRWGFARPI
jgi:hypothetical protein